jgi:hypothetical protein
MAAGLSAGEIPDDSQWKTASLFGFKEQSLMSDIKLSLVHRGR